MLAIGLQLPDSCLDMCCSEIVAFWTTVPLPWAPEVMRTITEVCDSCQKIWKSWLIASCGLKHKRGQHLQDYKPFSCQMKMRIELHENVAAAITNSHHRWLQVVAHATNLCHPPNRHRHSCTGQQEDTCIMCACCCGHE